MELIKLSSILLVAAVCVSARRLRPYQWNGDQQASYADVMQSLHLIDFNLNIKEKTALIKYYQERTDTTREEVEAFIKSRKYEDEVFRIIASSKVRNEEKVEFTDYKINAFMLAINYDLIAQILNPEYKKNIFTIPIEKDHLYTEAETKVLDMISKRWAFDAAGNGVSLPEGGLRNFYDGTSEELQLRKEGVLEINSVLNKFVKFTLSEAQDDFKYKVPYWSEYIMPPYQRYNHPMTPVIPSEDSEEMKNSKEDKPSDAE